MMRLKWEILIGLLAMLIGIVFIGWYMSEFQDIDSPVIRSIASEGDAAEVSTTNGNQRTTPVEENSPNADMAAKIKTNLQNGAAVNHAIHNADSDANDLSRLHSGDPGLGQWSDDRFEEEINKDQTNSDLSSFKSIRDEIASALEGYNTPVDSKDAYLTTIAKESSILTITTASEDKGLKFTRNIKPSTPSDNTGQPTLTGDAEEASLTKGFVVIRPGESLTAIAYRLYRDPDAYAKILELNKDVIVDPDHILAGQKIRLPAP